MKISTIYTGRGVNSGLEKVEYLPRLPRSEFILLLWLNSASGRPVYGYLMGDYQSKK